ncbi:MAG TPA: TetR/AcrR family transcriptional regulator [Pseudomonadales bacterium]|jgi:AcrR family transcriptional regulator|nr:TetR/AcrR family transcriptional regulator [Gammaproteobacteria bacterium]HIL85433.1 TetR/AcrR family transcriptional regulator [Pseudomonadales bacterium]
MLPSKPQNTRQQIIDAATRLLIEEGAGGFSVRKVAQGALISLGNLQYHFPTKNDLFYGLFEQVKDRVIAVAATEQDEEAQFFAYVDVIFEEWDTAAGSIPVWELGAMAAHDEDLAEMLHNLYTPFRKRLTWLIVRNNPDRSVRVCEHQATCIVAMIEGSGLFDAHSRSNRAEFRGMRKQLREIIKSIIYR